MAHTLLLADDSVTIQRVIELTFADEDVQVVAVGDGDQAIARLESAPPDIVLADIGMPGRNGYEVARYVKQSPKLSHIPVVLLTGAFEPVDQARANEVGCDGVLAKPFEPQLVIGRVKELLAAESKKPAPLAMPAPAAAPAPVPVPAPSPLPEPAAHIASAPEPHAELDDYFDRLDVAFSKLSANAPAPLRAVKPPEEQAQPPVPAAGASGFASVEEVEKPSSVADQIDWYASRQHLHIDEVEPRAADPAPVAEVPPAPPVPAPASAPAPAAFSPAPSAADRAAAPAGSRPAPTIAEAFAAILAVERTESADGRPTWPTAIATLAPPTVELDDQIIEQIVKRVLDRLTDRVVRETTHEVVTGVAERLVREEIDRIKSALK